MTVATEKRRIGDRGERVALRYLRLHGYRILARNYTSVHLELDIIAATLKTLAFVEVKTRTYTPETLAIAPPPGHAVNARKQEATRRAARIYLHSHPTKKQPRMDVIEVWLLRTHPNRKPRVYAIHHFKGAY